MKHSLRTLLAATLMAAGSMLFTPTTASAASAAELTRDAQAALDSLYAKNPGAKTLGKSAVAVLVFPSIVKAGLGIGGQYGEGVLFRSGKPTAYYSNAGASYGDRKSVV